MKSLMRVEKGGYLRHIKVSAWEQHHQRERMESSGTAVISAMPTEPPLLCLSLSLSVAWTATVQQVEQNDALQCFSKPLVHTHSHTHFNANANTSTHASHTLCKRTYLHIKQMHRPPQCHCVWTHSCTHSTEKILFPSIKHEILVA